MCIKQKYEITTDLFKIPYQNEYSILYAPKIGFACKANLVLVNLLERLDALNPAVLNEEELHILNFLDKKGVLNGSNEMRVHHEMPESFLPTSVTLFPSNQCNLRCKYCYASAGEAPAIAMNEQLAKNAIEIVIKNAQKSGQPKIMLGFHGGGEPLLPWHFIQDMVHYAEERCSQENLKLSVHAATNGVLKKKQLEWIIHHFTSLNISFDGLPEIQDAQRPCVNGKGSFRFIHDTLTFLDNNRFKYGIRSTISYQNVLLMENIVEFIAKNYQSKTIHLEPLFYCGRCKTNNIMSPDLHEFATQFLLAEKKAKEFGRELVYSGCHMGSLKNSFCGVSRDNFAVTLDGYITTCYEITSTQDPRSDVFIIGRINDDGSLTLDDKKRKYLHSLNLQHLDFCTDCYAKWNCGGECAAKIEHGDYTGDRGHERCHLNRLILVKRLAYMIDNQIL